MWKKHLVTFLFCVDISWLHQVLFCVFSSDSEVKNKLLFPLLCSFISYRWWNCEAHFSFKKLWMQFEWQWLHAPEVMNHVLFSLSALSADNVNITELPEPKTNAMVRTRHLVNVVWIEEFVCIHISPWIDSTTHAMDRCSLLASHYTITQLLSSIRLKPMQRKIYHPPSTTILSQTQLPFRFVLFEWP